MRTLQALGLALTCGVSLLILPAVADPAPSQTQPAASTAPANAPASTSSTTTPSNQTANPPASSATPAAPATKPGSDQVNEKSASYVAGYSDGCASSNLRYARQAHVKPGRDAKLYDSDNDYHAGWDKGYRKCEDRFTPGALPVMGNSVIM